MDELLHHDFREIGRSGIEHDRETIIAEFATGGELPRIDAWGFRLSILSETVSLLTYRTAHLSASGERSRITLRSSLWIRTDSGWKLRFHQGTASA